MTSRLRRNRGLAVALIFAGALISCQGRTVSTAPSQSYNEAISRTSSNEKSVIDIARASTLKHKLTELPMVSLAFEIVSNDDDNPQEVIVREAHRDGVSSDPVMSPRLFTLRIDLRTHQVWTDADSPAAEFRLLDP